MGILNVTPDSFSDGGQYLAKDLALRHAWQMCEDGADIIDIGGESTRPGAKPVSLDEELARVIPIVEVLCERHIRVSVDTSKPEVMSAAINAGAQMINDVNALRAEGAPEVVKGHNNLAICLMHMQGEPRTMQFNPEYGDVVEDIIGFFNERIEKLEAVGINKQQLIVDPGIGFGKTPAHNLRLLNQLSSFAKALALPLLMGVSRKSIIGKILQEDNADQRVVGSVAAACAAYERGAAILRVHDVKPTVEALKVTQAIRLESLEGL